MDSFTLARALDCLDTLTPRPANMLGGMLWPDRQFNTQQAAGAAARPILVELARLGLAQGSARGWIKTEAPNDE